MNTNISTKHQALVEKLKRMGLIRTPVVEAAFRAVPRHLFKLNLYNQITFGHPSLETLRIRAYPQGTNYIPSANESVIVKRWTYLVLDWQ